MRIKYCYIVLLYLCTYANKEKLIKQGDKEFHQGVNQLQDSRYSLTIKYEMEKDKFL